MYKILINGFIVSSRCGQMWVQMAARINECLKHCVLDFRKMTEVSCPSLPSLQEEHAEWPAALRCEGLLMVSVRTGFCFFCRFVTGLGEMMMMMMMIYRYCDKLCHYSMCFRDFIYLFIINLIANNFILKIELICTFQFSIFIIILNLYYGYIIIYIFKKCIYFI